MFRWLARYISRIDIFGVGVELREPPAEPAPPPVLDGKSTCPVPLGPPASAARSAQIPTTVPEGLPRPLPVRRVVQHERLATSIDEVLAAIPQGGKLGGLTIGLPGRPRALIYVGSCPDKTDCRLREVVKPYGYNASPVRDLVGLGGCRTATLEDPQGY